MHDFYNIVSVELTFNMIIRRILPVIVKGVCSSYNDTPTKDQEW
jgi:hypothetical protein